MPRKVQLGKVSTDRWAVYADGKLSGVIHYRPDGAANPYVLAIVNRLGLTSGGTFPTLAAAHEHARDCLE